MSTQILATERFARVGKSIHEVGEQQEELQKKRIDRQNHLSLPRTRRGEEHIDRHHEQRTDKDVTIHLEERTHPTALTHHSTDCLKPRTLVLQFPHNLAIVSHAEQEIDQKSAPLCNDGAQRYTFDLHAQSEHQDQRCNDIHHILGNGNKHRNARILHPYIPARQTKESKHSRRTPYTYIKIGGCQGAHVCVRLHQQKSQFTNRQLKEEDCQRNDRCNTKTAHQDACIFCQIPTSKRL